MYMTIIDSQLAVVQLHIVKDGQKIIAATVEHTFLNAHADIVTK